MDQQNSSAQFVPVTTFDLVVFGAAGDLALRKLIPALFHRWRDQQIPENSKIIGVSRSQMSDDAFRKLALESYAKFYPSEDVDQTQWARFCELLHYVGLDVVADNNDWSALACLLYTSDAADE